MKNAEAVLVIGAGLLQCALIREAQALGLYVIATDANPHAPGAAIADEFHQVSTADVPGHAQLAATLKDIHPCQLRGVVTAGCDCAPSVSAAAEAAGLPGIPLDVAQKTHNKLAVRSALTHAGLHSYQPPYCWRSKEECQDNVLSVIEVLDFPVVVKPLAQRASRGVRIVCTAATLAAAVTQTLQYGSSVLFEERLTGTEHSAELLMPGTDGEPLWWNIADRQFCYDGGLALETGHINPTCLPLATQDAIKQMMLAAATALGVYWGAFKGDVMVTTEGPKILELTARLSGGFDSMGTSPLTGRHPLRTLLQLACRLPVDVPGPPRGFAACAAILPSVTGCVRTLPSHGTAWALPWHTDATVEDIHWMIQPGDTIASPEHNAQRCGFVLAHADEYADAWQRAKSAADALAAGVEVEKENT